MPRHRRRQRPTLAREALSLPLFLLLSLAAVAKAADDSTFDCSRPIRLDIGGARRQFDLSSLAGVHEFTRERDTPPSYMVDEVRFDLCADLPPKDGVAGSDQCPSGSRACLTMINQKEGYDDRIVATIPLAISSDLRPEFTALASPRKGLNVVLHGSTYPPKNPLPQSFNISILCNTEMSDPMFVRYYGMQVYAEWSAPAGCAYSKDNQSGGGGGKEEDSEGGGSGGGGGKEKVGSGIGWFFLLLFLAFVAYLAIGAYHNYSTYGASGADLIPHRDFWREVPYIIRDIASHLCSALRPSSRSGYVAV